MKRPWLWCLLAATLCVGGTPTGAEQGQQPTQAAPLSLDALVTEALEKSSELAALRSRIAAAEARVGPAGALPDPMASFGLNNLPVGEARLNRDMMSSVGAMLSQSVTRGARRRLRSEIQRREVAALRERYTSAESGIVREVGRVYIDLQYVDEATGIAEANKQLAEDLLAIAESLYATGRVGQQDVFQSQVQLSRMLDSLVALRRQRSAAGARLNRLLYRPPDQPVPALPPLRPTSPPGDGISERFLMDSNSVLRELRARTEQAESRLDLAKRWSQPDYTVGFGYMLRQRLAENPMSGKDMWSVSLGLALPWINRSTHEEEVASQRSEQEAAEHDLQAQLNATLARAEELKIEIGRAEEQLSLVETGLLPQAEGALAASRAAYATGETDSTAVLYNQLGLYNLQLQRAQLLREHEQNVAELEYQLRGALGPMAMAQAAPMPSAAMMGAGMTMGRGAEEPAPMAGMSH